MVCDSALLEVSRTSQAGEELPTVPDRNGFRIYLEELHTTNSARLTRSGAIRVRSTQPDVSQAPGNAARCGCVEALEPAFIKARLALFLMRCLFTMFAEDVKRCPKLLQAMLEAAPAMPQIKHERPALAAMDKADLQRSRTEVSGSMPVHRNASCSTLSQESRATGAPNRLEGVDPAVSDMLSRR